MKTTRSCSLRLLDPGDAEAVEAAARVLRAAFAATGVADWETIEAARREVRDCLKPEYLLIAAELEGVFVGWIGFRPLYGNHTWELHPLAVDPAFAGRGIGGALVREGERLLTERGAGGILLGSDDPDGSTSLGGRDLTSADLFNEIRHIRNLKRHPFEFYRKLGYRIVGVIPDASAPGQPDILMWKSLQA